MKQRDYLRDGYRVNGVLVIISNGRLLCTACTTAGVCEHERAIRQSATRGAGKTIEKKETTA